MLNLVYTCVTERHDLRLVVLAGVVCLFACFATTMLYERAVSAQRGKRRLWMIGAAFVFGCGVWTTHFIAELAYRPGMPVGYDMTLTALSAAIAIVLSGIGIFVALPARQPAIGGAMVGGAVGAMHYVGVAAMRFPGELHWRGSFVVASLAIGAVLSSAAFAIQARSPRLRTRAAAAVLLVLAICGLHFVGMTAVSIAYDPTVAIPTAAIPPQFLAIAVAGVTAAIITIGFVGSLADDQLARRAIEEAARLQHKVDERTAELRQAQADLIRNERLTTIGQLTASIAHELRNPLSSVRNSLFTIQELAGARGLDLDRPLSRADRGVTRCARIIDELLDYTHSPELRCATMVAEVWIDSVLDEQTLPPEVTLLRDHAGSESRVSWDGDRMRRVLAQIIDNAVDAVGENSENVGAPRIVVATRASAGMFILTVADNGTGMPPERLSRVFEPLYSTKSFGTGLGLPSVRQTVEQHGGRIRIESTLGQGTKAFIELPLLAAARAAA